MRVTADSDLFWFRTRDDLMVEWGYGIGLWHLVRKSRAFMTAIARDAQGVPLHRPDGRLVEIPESCIALALLDEERSEFLGPFDPCALALPELAAVTGALPLAAIGATPG
jgi:hypothetical protein